jgi:hypothetical protein
LVEIQTKKVYFGFVKIDERTISELQVRVNTEHQKDIAAIKRVLRLIRKNNLLPQTAVKRRGAIPTTAPVMSNGHQNEVGIENQIFSTVEKFPGQFSFADLAQALKVSYPTQEFDRKVISGVIFQNKGKRIRVIQEGWGRRKAIYSKMSFMPETQQPIL